MPYYEFFNLPNAALPGVNVPTSFQADPGGRFAGGANPFSETAPPDEMRITVATAVNVSDRLWIGRPADFVSASIRRRVRSHSNQANALAQHLGVGDLVLYKVALMSAHPQWDCGVANPAKWPKVHLELDTQTGVRLKYTLERLVVDAWTLEVDGQNAGETYEVLDFRAWVAELSLPQGNPLKIKLGNAP